jgi:hypothetical protein
MEAEKYQGDDFSMPAEPVHSFEFPCCVLFVISPEKLWEEVEGSREPPLLCRVTLAKPLTTLGLGYLFITWVGGGVMLTQMMLWNQVLCKLESANNRPRRESQKIMIKTTETETDIILETAQSPACCH